MCFPCFITTVTATLAAAERSSDAPAVGWAGPLRAERLVLRSATVSQTLALIAGRREWAAVLGNDRGFGVLE